MRLVYLGAVKVWQFMRGKIQERWRMFSKQLRYALFSFVNIWATILFSASITYPVVSFATQFAIPSMDSDMINIIGWLYAGSVTLLAGLFFLVATLESQEKIQLYKGFYITYLGVIWSFLFHMVTVILLISHSTMSIPLQIVRFFVTFNAFVITFSILILATLFVFPSIKDAAIRRFLKIKFNALYALHNGQQQEYKKGQGHIDRILKKYDIDRDGNARTDSYYTPIVSGKSGYVVPRNNGMRRLGRKIKRQIRKLSSSSDVPMVKHAIVFGERISKGTSLLFVSNATDALKKKLSRWLGRYIVCVADPPFLYNDDVTTMENFREALLQTESIERFQFYRDILQDVLYRYIDNDYSVKEAREEQSGLSIFRTDHSIMGWYHRIAKALTLSDKAESTEWADEIVALYRGPVYHLYNSAEIPLDLLREFLNCLSWRYFEANRRGKVQTELQQKIMSQYDAFLDSLCESDQKIEVTGHDKSKITAIADMIIEKQAVIIKNLYEKQDINVFEGNVRSFMNKFSFGGDFAQRAFQSIDSSINSYHGSENGNDATQKTFEEYSLFQKEIVLLKCASYIFATKKLPITASEDEDPYLAYLVKGGFPTSLVRFTYLYCALSQDPAVHFGDRVWEDWQRPDSTSSINSSSITHVVHQGERLTDFFLWYGINKCEDDDPPLRNEQIPSLFPLPFRRGTESYVKRIEAYIAESELTPAQQSGAKQFIAFLRTLSASYNQERHLRIVDRTLNSDYITKVTDAFQDTYGTDNENFLRALRQQQIATELQPIPDTPNAQNTAMRAIQAFHEKIWYIGPIDDGAGSSAPTSIFTDYAHQFIDAKIDLIWQRWKEHVPHIPHTTFFDALREPNFTTNYIVVCNYVSTSHIKRRWRNLFPAPQFDEVFIPYRHDPNHHHNNNDLFRERIGDIQFQHDDADSIAIPVACFLNRNSRRAPTTFIILDRQKLGTFQQYSSETARGTLQVKDHFARLQITDIAQDAALSKRILKNPPDFIRQGVKENTALTPEELLKEYVDINISDAFEFEYAAATSNSLCGYIECDFSRDNEVGK